MAQSISWIKDDLYISENYLTSSILKWAEACDGLWMFSQPITYFKLYQQSYNLYQHTQILSIKCLYPTIFSFYAYKINDLSFGEIILTEHCALSRYNLIKTFFDVENNLWRTNKHRLFNRVTQHGITKSHNHHSYENTMFSV